MNQINDSKVPRQVYVQAERRKRQEKRSLSASFADGTSKLFSSFVAKKNGFLHDLSNKIESTLALSPSDNSKNGSHSCESATQSSSSPCTANQPTSPSHLNKTPSREERMGKVMPSLSTISRTNSKPDVVRGVSVRNHSRPPLTNQRSTSQERYTVNGMSVSFDEPIYSRPELDASFPVTNISVSDTASCEGRTSRTKHTPTPQPRTKHTPTPQPRTNHTPTPQPRTELNSHISETARKNSFTNSRAGTFHRSVNCISKQSSISIGRASGQSGSILSGSENQVLKIRKTNIPSDQTTQHLENNNKLNTGSNNYDEIVKAPSNRETHSADVIKRCPDKEAMDEISDKHPPLPTRTKTTSNNVDEILIDNLIKTDVDGILFDDFIKPDVDAFIRKESSNENLITFEPEEQKVNDSADENNVAVVTMRNVVSGNEGHVNVPVHRTASFGSEKSWSSVYSVDSQPDDVTIECMDFMKVFVDKVFNSSEDISQIEKAKFGELCQHFPGRLWFSRYVSSQRVHHKRVSENVFYSLMQYFAVCLFECYEADDFSPAKTLMNMCFTFNHEEQTEKIFLYMCMREQPIWRSLRFWNAAYFDAVQCERSRRPMPTNSDESETVSDDRQFQENITFGQLGTFACNMREFGLSKELCLEFLRKQSTIANLGKEQVNLLRENIERIKDI